MSFLRALVFLILLCSIRAHPITRHAVQIVPKVHLQPISVKSTLETPSLPFPTIHRFDKRVGAPTVAVGEFLGRVGLETPGFEKKCRKCCRNTIDKLVGVFPVLRLCSSCKLDKTVKPSKTCADQPLGFANTASMCFPERCTDMLIAARPGCFCTES